ncbi:hypothetical protein G7Y89_g3824 [Cudoniella acicularis]|uniref:Uncharacterized protein n=1 Tax=Cudoniella acicularis TaxID=354080 RepID=A0A8H4RQM7_9HELO|nr:hypothetical protein G7Y89_g3824 [Cudoniella acicularis]
MAQGTVTLDKVYFETLLRRAQFHTSGVDFTTPVDVPTVTIPKADHDNLLSSARQYANLRRNLFRGGIAEETLAVLIKDDAPVHENGDAPVHTAVEENPEGGAFLTQQSASTIQGNGGQDYTFGRNANYTPRNTDLRQRDTNGFHNHSQANDDFSFMPDGPDGFYDGGSGNNDSQTKNTTPTVRKVCEANCPTRQSARFYNAFGHCGSSTRSVSFLEEAHAQEFFRHVKRHDLYVRGKRVEIRWNDRQFILPGHVANKIAIGATRNLVIQNRSPKHTEEAIRDDLEHIHNLVVIKVAFSGQNAYISTNSVHNAMFARTCMMSRSTYKGSKIEWDSDECAAPLERPQYRRENAQPKKKDAPVMNRFELLNMDGDEGSVEDDEHDTSGLSFPTIMSATAGVFA